jgi:D-glycero-D-manno-heptose 1,7-bisphosphate phosphatase
MIRAVIFDRDGVLIKDTGFPHRPEDLIWIDGSLALLSWLRRRGILSLVATNQSGVARGFFPITAVGKFHDLMLSQVREAGGLLDRIAFCPHLESGTVPPFNIACECRKPKPGMLTSLLDEFRLRCDEAIMIGDRPTDLEAAQAAGIRGFLFSGGNLHDFVRGLLT